MKLIALSDGVHFVKVDDKDHHWLSQRSWDYNARGYAVCCLFGGRKAAPKTVYMHRLILLAPDSATVDHANHDGLDNRRANLRLATQTQQNANRAITFGASKYKGVYRRHDGLKWCAQIKTGGKQKYLGSFLVEEDAARRYNEEATKIFGEFAFLNKIPSRKGNSK